MAEEKVIDQQEQRALFNTILKELDSHGSLDDIVLIGGWALKLYHQHYKSPKIPDKMTTDCDFLFRQPPKSVKHHFNLGEYLKKMGFKEEISSFTGETRHSHQILGVDFLLPHIGPDDNNKPMQIPGYGIQATQLRYLDLSTEFTTKIPYEGMTVTVPEPAAYTYLKYIVGNSPSRREPKASKDIDTAKAMSDFIRSDPRQVEVLSAIIDRCPSSWNDKFFGSIDKHYPDFKEFVKEYRAERQVARFMLDNHVDNAKRGALIESEEMLTNCHYEKYRESIYRKTIEGLPSRMIPRYVNSYVVKGKEQVSVTDITQSRER